LARSHTASGLERVACEAADSTAFDDAGAGGDGVGWEDLPGAAHNMRPTDPQHATDPPPTTCDRKAEGHGGDPVHCGVNYCTELLF